MDNSKVPQCTEDFMMLIRGITGEALAQLNSTKAKLVAREDLVCLVGIMTRNEFTESENIFMVGARATT